ncbi:unnamed protein product [Calicophoron daubneyi]|uniref:Uncharacterized protein n=1 Tax=Calicophoron daubneyi TaxID=300641 RepID=A0AAV2SZW8_CALDB
MSSRLLLLYGLVALALVQCTAGGHPPHHKGKVAVLLRFDTYEYPLKQKADGKACNATHPDQYCSPAFRVVFIPPTEKETPNVTRFGGTNSTYANRKSIRFEHWLAKGLRNPLQYSLNEWKHYPVINLTITTNDFNATNLLGNQSFKLSWVREPERSEHSAKWHPIHVHLLKDQLKLKLSIKVFYKGRHLYWLLEKLIADIQMKHMRNDYLLDSYAGPRAGAQVHTSTTSEPGNETCTSTVTTEISPTPTNTTMVTKTERKTTSIHNTTTDPTTPNGTTTMATTTPSPPILTIGEIIGIAVGSFFFILIIIGVIVAVYLYRSRIFQGYSQMPN